MNKILPIILVVVLSGCSFSSSEYVCSNIDKNNYNIYLKITSSEILWDTDTYTYIFEINSETPTKIFATLFYPDDLGAKIVFHKKLLTFHEVDDNGNYVGYSSRECKEL
tara:strand:+ start:186 stop:512 length:327 start_codon:yes stop_codon:yes gene_type:complete